MNPGAIPELCKYHPLVVLPEVVNVKLRFVQHLVIGTLKSLINLYKFMVKLILTVFI